MTSPDKIDLAKIKVGDEVLVRAIVLVAGTFSVACESVGDTPREFEIFHDAIAGHTPGALAAGDRVKLGAGFIGGVLGEILAVASDEAWVRWNKTSIQPIWPLSSLERVS